jgi:hypothetical protein
MARATIQAVNLNANSLTLGTWVVSGTAGYDTGSPGGSITAWAGVTGVQFINNGNMVLGVANGATSTTAYILVGRKGGASTIPLYTAESVTIGASVAGGWVGPWSVQDFTQTDATQYSGAPGGVIGAAGVGYTCIDFLNTTTLTVRLYQLIPAIP